MDFFGYTFVFFGMLSLFKINIENLRQKCIFIHIRIHNKKILEKTITATKKYDKIYIATVTRAIIIDYWHLINENRLNSLGAIVKIQRHIDWKTYWTLHPSFWLRCSWVRNLQQLTYNFTALTPLFLFSSPILYLKCFLFKKIIRNQFHFPVKAAYESVIYL